MNAKTKVPFMTEKITVERTGAVSTLRLNDAATMNAMTAQMAQDLHTRKRGQLFVVSHLFGPLIATPIPLVLAFADPQPMPHVLLGNSLLNGFQMTRQGGQMVLEKR